MEQITVDRAVLYLAIDALEIYGAKAPAVKETIDALRAALEAKPTWTRPVEYTPPHMGRKPLSEDYIYTLYSEPSSDAEMIEFARAIESAHGITVHTIETDPAKIRAAFEEDDFQAGAV